MSAILETERVLLATMMLRPADCWRVDVAPEHFASEHHGDLLRAIRQASQDGKPVDPVSMCEYLDPLDRQLAHMAVTIGNADFLTSVPEAFGLRIVADWRRRKARDIGAQLMGEHADVDAAIASLMSLHATEEQHEFTSREAARSAVTELQTIHASGGKLPGVTTGLIDIDQKLGGLHRGDLIIVAGRAAMGKTAMLLGMAKAAAKNGDPVGLISGEQPVTQIALRLIAAGARINTKQFRTADFHEEEWPRVTDATGEVSQLPMWILDRSSPTLAEVYRVARRWKHKHGIRALYVDYLQRIQGEGERKFEQVGNVVRGLKNLARDLDIPVVVLAQVSRQVESGGKGRAPRLGDLSDSSEIEKEADQVLMLYREHYYDDNANPNVAQIIVEKNRHGPTGTVDVAWRGETMTFENYAAA